MLDTFKNILDLVKIQVGEEDPDTSIDTIIKEAINYAYIFDLSKIDKRITTSFLTPVNGVMTLPDNLHTIEKITPSLYDTEKRIGNAILTDRTNQFTMIYAYVPDPLVNDSDSPDLSYKLRYALVSYACYKIFSYKKKTNIAQFYLAEYESMKMEYTTPDAIEESVHDIYSNGGDE